MTEPKKTIGVTKMLLIGIAVISVATAYFVGQKSSRQEFIESSISNSAEVDKVLKGRAIIEPAATGSNNLSRYVGLVIIRDEGAEGFDLSRDQMILTFRPAASELESEVINRPLFTGKVEQGASVEAGLAMVGVSIQENQIAEIIVKDEYSVGIPQSLVPAKALQEAALELPAGKELWYIESATLTSVTYKTYNKTEGSQSIDGTAFKAKGNFYSTNEQFRYQPRVSLMAWPISTFAALSRPRFGLTGNPQVPTHEEPLAQAAVVWKSLLEGQPDQNHNTITNALKTMPAMQVDQRFSQAINRNE